ncbi:MAG TPA: hypothetical protein VHW66_11155 [Stellaceae bacterium]|jgi:predicted nucleic acid-binding protein|nr:hypothetical protein [Stellaceae bacterium]
MIYIDSSVVLSRFLEEGRTPPDAFWDAPLASSKLLEYEVLNRMYVYDRGDPDIADARALLRRMLLVELSTPVLSRALEPLPHHIRTLDGLHLATMDYLRRSGEIVELASYDNRMIAAAEAMGIDVAAL